MTCIICQDPISGNSTKCDSCGKPCHVDCVNLWISVNNNCPSCGRILRKSGTPVTTVASSSPATRSFEVNVQGTKGDVHQLMVNPGLEISKLKDDVRRSFGIPSYSFVRLVHDGVQLFDRQRAGECLQNGASIIMTSNANGASVASMQRLMSEYKKIRDNKPPNISIQQPSGNIFLWKGVILGPSKSAWAGGVFPIEVRFPQDYPVTAPQVFFTGNMFHPNVYKEGKVCISTLAGDYESSHSVISLLTAIQSMLPEPNVKSIANTEAGNMFMSDIVNYHKRVRGIVGGM